VPVPRLVTALTGWGTGPDFGGVLVQTIRSVSFSIFTLLILGFGLLNIMVYADVLNLYLAWFSWAASAVFISVFKDRKLALGGALSFLLIGLLSVVLLLPSYTFNEATELVINEHGGELVGDYAGNWSIGSDYTSFVKLESAYLIKVEKDDEVVYIVHPNTGEIKGFELGNYEFD